MAMEVLLRRNIEGVGEVGEMVKVKPGFARNYLLPKGFAALVTPDALRRIQKDKVVEAKRQAELAEYHSALVEQLRDMELTVEARAGEDGHLYGSVAAKHVIGAFLAAGYEFQERQLGFEPVREIGEYEVPVRLSADHEVTVMLWVVQDARDIEALKERAAEAAAAAEAEEAEAGGETGTDAAADAAAGAPADAPEAAAGTAADEPSA